MTSSSYDTDVLIIGAGPTGLTAALVLAQSGVRVHVIERDDGPIDESRALIVQSRVQEFLDKMGLIDEALARGKGINGAHVMTHGKKRAFLPMSGDLSHTPYPLPLVFEQDKTQRLLIKGLATLGVSVQWSTEFVTMNQDDAGVEVLLRAKG